MWSAIKAFFSGGDSEDRRGGGQTHTNADGDEIDADAARDELTAVRAQIGALQLQIDTSRGKLVSVIRQEYDMQVQQAQILMECHDGYLHPQLEDESALSSEQLVATLDPSFVEEQDQLVIEAAALVTGGRPADGQPDPDGAASENAPKTLEERRHVWLSDTQDRGVLPSTCTAPQSEALRARIRAAIAEKAHSVAVAVPGVLQALRQKREAIDDMLFKLEVRLTQLESSQRHVDLRVRELEMSGTGTSDDPEAIRQRAIRRRRYLAAARRAAAGGDEDPEDERIVVVTQDPRSPDRQEVQPRVRSAAAVEMSDKSDESSDDDVSIDREDLDEIHRLRRAGDPDPDAVAVNAGTAAVPT